jgi:hypothetical protein
MTTDILRTKKKKESLATLTLFKSSDASEPLHHPKAPLWEDRHVRDTTPADYKSADHAENELCLLKGQYTEQYPNLAELPSCPPDHQATQPFHL